MLNRLKGISPLFVMIVLVPTLLSAIYYGFLAEDVYVSESRFVVRSPGKPDTSMLGTVLGGSGIGGATEESEAVREFLRSRAALAQINQNAFVENAYGKPSLFILDRYGGLGSQSFEQLYEYFQDKLSVEEGESVLVLRLGVEAFDPSEAQQINERLLQRSETLVNELSDRARDDAIGLALDEIARARENARAASLALARFRDNEGVIDPQLQAQVGLQTIAQLQEELIEARTRLRQIQTYTPEASQIPFLRTQVRELEGEIARQTAQLAGGRQSLSTNTARFQELELASQFAEQQLALATASLQDARAEALRKQAYVERIADPSLPDYPAYPKRIRNIFATLLLALLAWGIVSMLLTGVREHRD